MKKVLVIDDSALMRRVISDIINQDENLTVAGTANNGEAALDQLLHGARFDILLVDIKMPKMDGVRLMRELNRSRITTPALIVSSIASESGTETIEALELGAIDFVKKPISSIGENFADFRIELLQKVYVATGLNARGDFAAAEPTRPEARTSFRSTPKPQPELQKPRRLHTARKGTKLVVIASSTGGPKALQSVVPFFPANFPYPVVIVQHMPAGFTNSLAQRLDEMSQIRVKEAADGEELKPGVVYIAMGGKQCELVQKANGSYCFSENDKPPRGGLRPCADIFFESLVDTTFESIICGVLTGMGSDGCKGISLIREMHNVSCVAQNKETCVVYGMPRAVAESGIADDVVPLEDVTGMLVRKAGV
ncbi:MAG: chemotaxis-specific protein-glutamate methyltransferase CheB [Eubacterium sp.]|nr:chemotaxis-specific protein-glutamate methyltransferase CheB [Eubacterium sp.]